MKKKNEKKMKKKIKKKRRRIQQKEGIGYLEEEGVEKEGWKFVPSLKTIDLLLVGVVVELMGK